MTTPPPYREKKSMSHTTLTHYVLFMLGLIVLASLACGENNDTTDTGCPSSTPEACAVIELVNQERSKEGRPALEYNAELALSAQRHAEDMVQQNYFSHTSKDGRDFVTRTKEAGYDGFPTGENIAAGQRDANSVMNSWMNSTGHKNNILSKGSQEIGVGFHNNHWVQVFGSPKK